MIGSVVDSEISTIHRLVGEFGFCIVQLAPLAGEGGFAHTVGLGAMGHADLVAACTTGATAAALRAISHDIRSGAVLQAGMPYPLPDLGMAIVILPRLDASAQAAMHAYAGQYRPPGGHKGWMQVQVIGWFSPMSARVH
jgi:hypothetical protein